jgi:hypothetical protein
MRKKERERKEQRKLVETDRKEGSYPKKYKGQKIKKENENKRKG